MKTPQFREIEAVQEDQGGSPPNVVRQRRPFEIRVTLDATDVHTRCDSRLRLTLFAHEDRVEGASPQRLGVLQQKVSAPVVKLALRVEPATLAPGVYRLEAAATLECVEKEALLGCAFTEGDRLRVIA